LWGSWSRRCNNRSSLKCEHGNKICGAAGAADATTAAQLMQHARDHKNNILSGAAEAADATTAARLSVDTGITCSNIL